MAGYIQRLRRVSVLLVICYAIDREAWSVCRSVTVRSCEKMAEPIEMPFGLNTWVGPRNHVLDGGPHPLWEEAILRGKGLPIAKYRDTLP